MAKKSTKVVSVVMSCSMVMSNITPINVFATTNVQQVATTAEKTLTDFTGDNKEVIGDNLVLKNTGTDNFAMSKDVKEIANDFHYSADVMLSAGGDNSAALIFGVLNKDKPSDNWKGANVLKENTGNIMRVFKVPNGEDLVNKVVLENYDVTKKIHLDLDVKVDGTFVYTVQSEGGSLNQASGTIDNWQGGYIGLLTFKTEATYSNIKFSDRTVRTEDNFDTNLVNLKGLSGIWTRGEDGLSSVGNGDNFAVSDSKVKNFTYQVNVNNKNKKGAGALMFRVENINNPKSGCYVLNVDYTNKIIKLFEFPTGGTIAEVPLSDVEPNADGSYDIKVIVVDSDIYAYANGKGIIRANDKRHSDGNLGLLTWDASVVYQNLNYQATSALPTVKEPELQDLKLSNKVTITPSIEPSVGIYGMDVPSGVESFQIEPTANGKTFITLKDRSQKVTRAREEVSDTYTVRAEDFETNFLNMVITVENDGFSKSYQFYVNKWFSKEELASQENRAQFHVTPQVNFMNDPNGMVYDSTDGYWHLFYQYSPNNNFYKQSWAHVRSKDLVNWEQQPLGIQIDDLGLIFSGSAVEDKDNTSGFFTNNKAGESRLVSIYTYHSEKTGKQSQAVAYSKDHGKTWVKYDNNPVLPNEGNSISGNDFRDPKVFKVEGDSKWYMITAGGAAQIYVSEDLKTWTHSQDLKYKNGDQIYSECPGLIPAKVNGTGEQKWIYNGSAGFYIVGHMEKDGDTFKWRADSEKMDIDSNGNPWGGFGKYATMTFFEDGAGKNREIGISWLQDFIEFDGKISKGSQSLPQEYGLITDRDGNYVVTSNVVEEVEKLRDLDHILYQTKNKKVNEKDDNILRGVSGIRYDVEGVFTLGSAKEFGFKLRKGNGKELIYKYDVEKKQMIVDGRNAGYHVNSGNFSYKLTPLEGNKVKLRILIDQGAVEAFGNDGEANISTTLYQDNKNIGMEFYTTGGDVTIDSLNIYDMKSMYSGKSGSESEDVQLYVSAKERVHVNTAFRVDTNIYPNIQDTSDITWTIPEGLSIVKEDKGSIVLKGDKAGAYTITANAGGLTKDIVVNVIVPKLDSNITNWSTNDIWEITEQGIEGKNTGGDSFQMSDTKMYANKPFTLEADMEIKEGTAGGLVFGVKDKANPTSLWFCVNIERTTTGDIAKIFKNANGQAWHIDTPLPSTKSGASTYQLKVVYNGSGTLTYYVNGNKIAEKTGADVVDGYIGVQSFKSNTVFNNINITFPDTSVTSVKDTLDDAMVAYKESDVTSKLPTTLQVELDNGNTLKENVTWDTSEVDTTVSKTYVVKGEVLGYEVSINVFVQADKTAMKAEIDKASTVNEKDYTAESYQSMKAVLKEAMDMYADDKALQEHVNAKTKELQDVLKALVEIEDPVITVDKAKLEEMITLSKTMNADAFTEESYAALQSAIKQAEGIMLDKHATQQQVDEQVSNLENALQSLVIKDVVKGRESLVKLVNMAKQKDKNAYTSSSWTIFEKAMREAQAVLELENPTQEDINHAYQNLMKAVMQLENKKDTPITSPDTGDVNTIGLTGLFAILSGGLFISLKKKRRSKE